MAHDRNREAQELIDLIPSGDEFNKIRHIVHATYENYPETVDDFFRNRILGYVREIETGDNPNRVGDMSDGRSVDEIAEDYWNVQLPRLRGQTADTSGGGTSRGETRTPSDPTPPTPESSPSPAPEPVDFKARVKALYPWLPDNLTQMFADEWADSGDPQLALAEVRSSKEYEQAFPGIKRDDGSLRMSEQEWFSTREAYSRLFQDFGLNDTLFNDRFTELMEGDVSPQELAGRLGAAYEMINNNLSEVASEFQEFYGGNSEAALFASFIDPDIGQAILDRRISVAQVAGEGTARGFDVDESFAGRLVSGGVGQEMARNLFIQAEGQLQTLDDLARRHRDPDDTFDLEEFAEANVFGDASQTRRIRRLLRAEASMFTDQLGQVQAQGGALTGLSPR